MGARKAKGAPGLCGGSTEARVWRASLPQRTVHASRRAFRAGRRALKNAALGYLTTLGDEAMKLRAAVLRAREAVDTPVDRLTRLGE